MKKSNGILVLLATLIIGIIPTNAQIVFEKGGLYLIRSKKYASTVLNYTESKSGISVTLRNADE